MTYISIALGVIAVCAIAVVAIGVAAVWILAKQHPEDVRFDRDGLK